MTKEFEKYRGMARIPIGIAMGAGTFVILGTITALWDNPFFIRMTPAGGWEIAMLAALSILFGLYVVVRNPLCSMKAAGGSGVLGLIGIACPVCNKVLLLVFGGQLLLTYFEPIRIYVAAMGVLLMGGVMLRELMVRSRNNLEDQSLLNAESTSRKL